MAIPNFEIYLNHWTLFVRATHILLKDKIIRVEVDQVHDFLTKFVRGTEILNGKAAMTSNLHSLLHLAQKLLDWGPLWAHSGYPFEGYIGKVKKMVHASKGVLSQIRRRIMMNESINIIRRKVGFRSSKIIKVYKNLCRRKTLSSTKSQKIRYFGKRKYDIEELMRERFGLIILRHLEKLL